MNKTSSKGFTLLELLTVIAIIGIFASIIVASLTSARNKGKDASLKSAMGNLRTAAEVYFGNNGGYGTSGTACNTAGSFFVDTTSNSQNIMDGISSVLNGTAGTYTNMDCANSSTAWAVAARLPTSPITGTMTWICVDSTGNSKLYSSTAIQGASGSPKSAAGTTVCQ